MSKVLKLLFILFFGFTTTFASEDLHIISREEWGANEEYRYLDSVEWKNILKGWEEAPISTPSEAQKEYSRKKAIKTAAANSFLNTNFLDLIKLESNQTFENNHKLAWPIGKTKKVTRIIIHHTNSEYSDSYEAVRQIYKYHALTRKWGDVGYNYLIGYNGEIFEGRAGGDYVVGAHAKWNNRSSVGIALIGNYDEKPISEAQYKSLEKLTESLIKKYDIDLGLKAPYFRWCNSGDCPNPLDLKYIYPIGGHRDGGHTECPGDELYRQIGEMRKKLQRKYFGFDIELLNKKLEKLDEHKILSLLVKLESMLESEKSPKKLLSIQKVKKILINFEKNKHFSDMLVKSKQYDDLNKIKVKLSYPHEKYINIKIKGKFKPKLLKKDNTTYIKTIPRSVEKEFNFPFTLEGNILYLNNKRFNDFSENKFVKISLPNSYYSTITSWDRKPSWDKTGELNDNKFKGDIVIYLKDNKLVVVNELILSDYLKGLGEVSNFENVTKIETIIILARTYARWYMQKARKFPGEYYDASDDSNVFQKYLGYGLELRSPNVNRIVEKTKNIVVTYKDDIIKPWYFSKSDGKTLSFLDYCIKNTKDEESCTTESKKYPFLSSIEDPGGNEEKNLGHGVGVSGSGVKYFSERGWISQMIIKYFLKGTSIGKF